MLQRDCLTIIYLSMHRLSSAELKLMSVGEEVNEVTLLRAHPSIFVFRTDLKMRFLSKLKTDSESPSRADPERHFHIVPATKEMER